MKGCKLLSLITAQTFIPPHCSTSTLDCSTEKYFKDFKIEKPCHSDMARLSRKSAVDLILKCER